MISDEQMKSAASLFLGAIPHCRILGMQVEDVVDGSVIISMPFSEELEANPGSGIIHSGSITTLMDSSCGMAACMSVEGFETCPTLDLRLDYLGLPDPFEPVRCAAEAYQITQSIIFTRGICYQKDKNKPFAHGVGTFMRMGKKLSELAKEMGL